jgi:tetratricopeptide (TPR) repeat protein
MPASLDSFKAEVGRRGFDHAAEVYAAMQKDQPDFKLEAQAVASWAYQLLVDRHLPEAINIMKLGIELDPSDRAYSSLGEMFMKSGQKLPAIDSYKKALEKNPNDILAKQRLEELEAGR